MKHKTVNQFISRATTFAILMACVIIFSPRNALADTQIYPSIDSAGVVTVSNYSTFGTISNVTAYTGTYPSGTPITTACSLGCSNIALNGFYTMEDGWANGGGTTNDGDHWVKFDSSTLGSDIFWVATRSGGSWNGPVDPDLSGDTRIISFSPENGTTTDNTVDFELVGYVAPEDINENTIILFRLHNIDQNVLLAGASSPSDILLYNEVATTSGAFLFSTSTVLADGNYRLEACLRDSRFFFGFVPNPFAGGEECQSHQFIVNEATFIGNISQQSFTATQAFFASSTATSTIALAGSCNPLSGTFDMMNCMAFVFIPDAGLVKDSLTNFRDNVATHFPLGYITDFINIISTSTESSLIILDTTLPSALGFGTPRITLDLSHILDDILYSTSTIFQNEDTDDTKNFYEITSYYWRIIVYILALLYIIGRILGSHLIPRIHHISPNKDIQ